MRRRRRRHDTASPFERRHEYADQHADGHAERESDTDTNANTDTDTDTDTDTHAALGSHGVSHAFGNAESDALMQYQPRSAAACSVGTRRRWTTSTST